MSLEERTLVVRNISDDRVSKDLLLELFNQAGPVVNVVLRHDFAYIEFEHKISVSYALALLRDISLFGQTMVLEPKLRNDSSAYHFLQSLNQFEEVMARNPNFFTQYMPNNGNQRRLDYDRRRRL